jgi:hypothetical protein
VDLACLQVTGGDVLERASHDRGEDRSQQQVAGVVWEVVVAAALVGVQDGQPVVGAERDDCQAWVDPRVPAAADRSQQSEGVSRALKLAEDQYVDRTGRDPRDNCFGVVGLVEGVPVGIKLRRQERLPVCVDGGYEQRVLLCRRARVLLL